MRVRPSSVRTLATSWGLVAGLWTSAALAAPQAESTSVETAAPPDGLPSDAGSPDEPADDGTPLDLDSTDEPQTDEPQTDEPQTDEPQTGAFETSDDSALEEPSTDDVSNEESTLTDTDRQVPRVSGPYLGLGLFGAVSATRVNQFDTDGALAGGGGYLRFGQMILPWLGIGLQGGGSSGSASNEGASQRLGQGALLVDFNFVPAPRRVAGLSVRASFGFGGGAVREEGVDGRAGFGGAFFGAGARYEFFPGVKRYRPSKGGGFGIGPEIGWLGATPSARGRPMANTFFTGLSLTFYFGD